MHNRLIQILTLTVFLLTGLTGWSQNAIFQGTIRDLESGDPLGYATIKVLTPDNATFTGALSDENGQFEIKDIPPGTYSVSVSSQGYRPYYHTLDFNAGEIVQVRLELAVSALTLPGATIIGGSLQINRFLTGTGTRIPRRTVELMRPIGTQEMLQYVPGINGFADDGFGNSRVSIGIRGMNPRRSSRILFMEDGIPVQPAPYLYPNMYYNPPVERIDEFEVIKGSAAIKYGPQTMGGVINYITRKPQRNLNGKFSLTGGTNGYRSAMAAIGGFGNDKIMPEVQLLYKGGNGYRDNNEFNQFNGTFRLNIVPDDRKNLQLKFNVNHELANATYTGLTEYSFANEPTFNPKENDEFQVQRLSFDAIYKSFLSDKVASTTKLYMNTFDRRWWREYDVFVDPATYDENNIVPLPWYTSGDLMRVGNGESNFGILRTFYVVGAEHEYDWQHGTGRLLGNLETGVRLHWERFVNERKEGDSPTDREGSFTTLDTAGNLVRLRSANAQNSETTALSFYALEKINIDNRLSIEPGVRLEAFEQSRVDRLRGNIYSDKVSFVVLPGLGVNYRLKAFNIFGGIHRGYTPPSSGSFNIWDAQVADSTAFDLEAEKSWNKEIGIRGRTKFMSVEAAFFHLNIEDMVAGGRGTAFKNLGSVVNYGVELGGSIDFFEFLGNFKNGRRWLPTAHFAYTWLQTEIKSGEILSSLQPGYVSVAGKSLPYAPTHTVTAGLSKQFHFGFSARADVYFVSDVFTDFENIYATSNRGDQGVVPGYTLFNAAVDYRLKNNWVFSLSGKNLFDTIYIGSRLHSNPRQTDASSSSGIMPGPRRQINLGLTYRFTK